MSPGDHGKIGLITASSAHLLSSGLLEFGEILEFTKRFTSSMLGTVFT